MMRISCMKPMPNSIAVGDPEGHFRRALATFPNQQMVERALDKYFIPEGKAANKPYRSLPLWTINPPRHLEEAAILGNYCEVWLAKHNDDGSPTGGVIGINRLTKVALVCTVKSCFN
jgi:hypothetical protein